MDWYYAEGSAQRGPVNEEQFNQLIAQGAITAETLVWRAGMSDWLPYGQVQPAAASPDAGATGSVQAESTAPASAGEAIRQESYETDQQYAQPADGAIAGASAGGAATSTTEAITGLYCCECGRRFSTDEMINYGPSWVCAECKPLFFQKIREGATGMSGLVYAGFWIRFVAKFIDGIILGVIELAIGFVFGTLLVTTGAEPDVFFAIMQLLSALFSWGIRIFYNTFFVGKFAATPGKMALGLKVVMPDGGRVTYLRAFGRMFAEILSGLICLFGYIMAAFDGEKRALHDHICSTRVIRS